MRVPGLVHWLRHPALWALLSVLPFATLTGCSEDDETDGKNVENLELVSKFAYVSSNTVGYVSGYVINSNTGALTPVEGNPYPVGGLDPRGMTANPEGTRLYVATSNPSQINVFDIDPDTGELTELASSPFISDDDPQELVIAPDGKFLYCACRGDPAVTTYEVDSAGRLGLVQSIPNGGQPYAIALDLTAGYVFVPNRTTGLFHTFFRIPGGGGLAEVSTSPFNTAGDPLDVAVHPVTGNVYVVERTTDTLRGFEFDSGTGELTAISGSPWSPGLGDPRQLVISPDGKHLYVADSPATLWGFSINDAGQVTALSPPNIATPGVANFLSFTLDGSHLYAVNDATDNISVFSRNASTGALTAISGSPFVTEDDPYGALVVNQYE